MIIGISGFKGSGKGTVAKVLEEYGFVRMSCSGPLKDMVSMLFSWPRYLLEGDTEESRRWREQPSREWQHLSGHGIFSSDEVITPRLVLQRIGTDLFRNSVHSEFWILLLQRKVEMMHSSSQREGTLFRGVILDDARFLNELSICDLTILVQRYDVSEEELQEMHSSEKEHLSFPFDIVLSNRSTLSSLSEQIEKVVLPQLSLL